MKRMPPRSVFNSVVRALCIVLPLMLATACAQVNTPDGRTVDIPTVSAAVDRYKGINERRDAITRVKLGKDVLVPKRMVDDPLPNEEVGPYELRGETLASALQLILDDYDISLAFESDLAMTTYITVANLRGPLDRVIDRVCGLANLYCEFSNGSLTVKETETFVVDLPPLPSAASGVTTSGATASYQSISTGLQAIIGQAPTLDETTRVIVYTATQRANKYAVKYFERLRKNTAMIIYEINIWEVNLSNENRTGINWEGLANIGNFSIDLAAPGASPTGTATPISITPSYTTNGDISSEMIFEFISEQGTVKTVSQPQLTVLSGSSASLAVQQSENFVSGISRTPSTTAGVPDTVSTTTETIETGLSLGISSAWDRATVYGTISIELDELIGLDEFTPDENTTIQLPQTTSRTLQTQIRVRPGDAVLVAGVVTERDDFSGSGPGYMKPLVQTSRAAVTRNTELVFLMRPRVITFEDGDDSDTPAIVDARGEKADHLEPKPFNPADLTEDVGEIFNAAGAADTVIDDVPEEVPLEKKVRPAKLPMGILADDLMPAPAEPVVMPEEQEMPAVEEAMPAYQPEQQPAPPEKPEPGIKSSAETELPVLPVPISGEEAYVPVDMLPVPIAEQPVTGETPNSAPASSIPQGWRPVEKGGNP